MAVPRHQEVAIGKPVNIVLKADQRTGKLTSGKIQDILTKGDHPHGVKVRLVDGRIGRVQSLARSNASPSSLSRNGNSVTSDHTAEDKPATQPAAVHTANLFDYIKPSKSRGQTAQQTAVNTQEQLESIFPGMDPSLIAAIMVDYPVLQDAKNVLDALSIT